jgi:hypothetical protein
MANHTGIDGTVKIGSNAVAEVRSFSIKMSAETIEDTTITDTAKTFVAGQTSWSADVSCFWDETDTSGQGAMTAGSSVTLNLYPEGAASGDTYWTGSAIVTSMDVSTPTNGLIEASFSAQGSGALTKTTV